MACGERLLKKLDQLERAYTKLKDIPFLEPELDREILYEVSAKRFEYTYEVLWKTVRLFLLERKGLSCNSPLDCFKALFSAGLLEENLARLTPSIVRKRNEIVHIYDFATAEDVYTFIKETVIPVFGKIVDLMRQECEKEDEFYKGQERRV